MRTCKITPGCENLVEGRTDGCASCNHAARKEERQAKKFKTATKIKVVTDKRAGELRTFAKQKVEYLDAYMCCEVPECHNRSVDVHHMGTRTNHNLNDWDNFIALCRLHHDQATEDSAWAKSIGISRTRTTNHTKA